MNNIVYNMDCIEGMKQYPDKHFELAIVDPPYGININKMTQGVGGKRSAKGDKKYKKGEWDSKTPDAEYFKELFRVSKNQIIWGANYMTQYLPSSMGWIFWDKGQRICNSDGELAFSSFNRALRVVEYNRVELLKEGTIHPTQKPIKLYKWLLQHYAKPGDKILDTHLGSGSSRIAAYDLGFDFTAFELDPEYFEAQEKRFNQHIAQLQIF
jgi:site-specific DNA-methyltransferase (adenine-specific)